MRPFVRTLALAIVVAACAGEEVSYPAALDPLPELPDDGPGTRVVPRRDAVPGYRDQRPTAHYELRARDHGVVLRRSTTAGDFDALGARDVWVWEDGGRYYMHYDAAGPTGWLVALATSDDLLTWTKRGLVMSLGGPNDPDRGSASYGVTYKEGDAWHMFYLGTPHVFAGEGKVPMGPYLTLKAKSESPTGPWRKQRDVVPFWPAPGTFYEGTSSPGHVVKHEGEYLQFFSSAMMREGNKVYRTIGLARTRDLDGPWDVHPFPVLPVTEQIENAAIYVEPTDGTWYMFVNHVGMDADGTEYTDAIWVYWTKNPFSWLPHQRALVLDGRGSSWSKRIIGLPSVLRVGDRLALFYDGRAGSDLPLGTGQHMGRDVGLAWLDLPLVGP